MTQPGAANENIRSRWKGLSLFWTIMLMLVGIALMLLGILTAVLIYITVSAYLSS